MSCKITRRRVSFTRRLVSLGFFATNGVLYHAPHNRTLLGEREQAIHCGNEMSGLPVGKVSGHSTQAVACRFISLLSAKGNCMSQLQKVACYRVVPYNEDNCPT